MSIVSVTEDFLGQTGNNSVESVTFKRQFFVVTDSFDDRALDVMTADGIPQPGEEYEDNTDYAVQNAVPRLKDNDPLIWLVEVNYNKKAPTQPGSTGDKPWDLKPQIAYGFMARQKVLENAYSLNQQIPGGATRGIQDVPVVNSLGMPFDPPAMEDEYLLVITIDRNIQGTVFDSDDVGKYQYTINNNGDAPGIPATFRIAGIDVWKYQALCRDYKATKAYSGQNELYWQERIEIIIDRNTWLRRLVDQGFFTAQLGVSSGVGSSAALWEYTPIKDTEGKRILEPVLLDGNGQRLPALADPVYLSYHAIWEEDWTGWLPSEAD